MTNFCDHGHDTRDEIRALPIGGHAQVFVCSAHYAEEMNFRRERIAAGAPFELPAWNALAINQPAHCDGDHAAPRCSDAQCWQGDEAQP